MEAIASLKYARVGAQKARLVADLVRGKDVGEAVKVLTYLNKKSGLMIDTPIQFDGFLDDQCVRFSAGTTNIISTVLWVRNTPEPLACAILVGTESALSCREKLNACFAPAG